MADEVEVSTPKTEPVLKVRQFRNIGGGFGTGEPVKRQVRVIAVEPGNIVFTDGELLAENTPTFDWRDE